MPPPKLKNIYHVVNSIIPSKLNTTYVDYIIKQNVQYNTNNALPCYVCLLSREYCLQLLVSRLQFRYDISLL